MSTVSAPKAIPAGEFIDRLRELSEGVITKQTMYDFLVTYEIRAEDLERYKLWLPDRHTRNKIFRNDMIECMLICWPIGAITPLHTHNGQLGWMTMIRGKLIVDNFRYTAAFGEAAVVAAIALAVLVILMPETASPEPGAPSTEDLTCRELAHERSG